MNERRVVHRGFFRPTRKHRIGRPAKHVWIAAILSRNVRNSMQRVPTGVPRELAEQKKVPSRDNQSVQITI
jgi:hypothetical protein